ncbi:MAG: rod shape-determining protein MreD, partial [Muribaculaceae bacterium]|nr:rod shape-determining protein MreD [Muribaculaceae bacterium]
MNLNLNWTLTFAFLLGFIVDVFSDIPGVNSLACTILAVLKRPVYFLYVPKDDKTKEETPTLRTLGPTTYCKYLLTLTALYCLMVFSFDFFSI